MELLTITHEDFVLSIECGKFTDIWHRAITNIGEDGLVSTYSWTEGVKSVVMHIDGDQQTIEKETSAPAIFFENADYPIWVEFNNYVSHAAFGSVLQSDNEHFSFRKHILAGFLNYSNEIGRSELVLVYQVGKDTKKFVFSYTVLSTKLDYHKHWRIIIEDIEREYRMLSLDYLQRTFHGFTPDFQSDTPEIVWWSIFAKEQVQFMKACKNIIERPHHRLHRHEAYKRADRLTTIQHTLENEIAEHRTEIQHLYRIEEQVQTNDTQENRFLKFAIAQITKKYDTLRQKIEQINSISDVKKAEIRQVSQTLQRLSNNPFFRTIGRYKGMNQESLVLQKATGYSVVYRTWALLRCGYSLYDGLYRLETKDIATLYEIWCFIELSHIVKEQMDIADIDMDHRNRMEMNGLFTWELGKGEHSRILFRKNGVELAELVYNPKQNDRENCNVGLNNLIVPTVPQKPDIVLQLSKDDAQKGMKMTYLFDAKYRIGSSQNGVDTPPDDAINQMHRYRDAIYYKDSAKNSQLKKEVIGGYILFPGNGNPADVIKSKFYKTINEVNIGAFPLRPKDTQNRQLLEQFIQTILGKSSTEILDDTIPQKGLYYTHDEPKDTVYMILTLDKDVNKDLDSVLQGRASSIIMGRKGMEETKDIQAVRFIAPIIPGGNITGYYKVTKASLAQVDNKKYPIRIKFDVVEWQELKQPAKFGMPNWAFRGVCKTRDEFFKHCKEQMVVDKL